jgi:hypothetical protein
VVLASRGQRAQSNDLAVYSANARLQKATSRILVAQDSGGIRARQPINAMNNQSHSAGQRYVMPSLLLLASIRHEERGAAQGEQGCASHPTKFVLDLFVQSANLGNGFLA